MHRICWVADSVDIHGGGAKRLSLWLHYLDRRKYDITFLYASNNRPNTYAQYLGQWPNVKLINIDRMKSKMYFFLPGVLQLYRWLIQHQTDFDLVHLLSPLADLIAIPAFKLARKSPRYLSMTGGPKFPLDSPAKKWVFRCAHRIVRDEVDLYLTVSENDRRELIDYYHVPSSKVRVHRIGLDFDKMAAQQNRKRETAAETVYGFAGRFSNEKGLHTLIDTIALMEERRRSTANGSIKFIIAGDGPLRPRIVRTVRERQLDHLIDLRSWQNHIEDFFQHIDVLLVPSLWEGTPRIILEAAFFGVPTIASKVGGIPEIVRDGETGILVPPKDPMKLMQAILRLHSLHDVMHHMGQNAKSLVLKSFGIQRSVIELEEIYDGVLMN